eukprot:UN13440
MIDQIREEVTSEKTIFGKET